jgi:hypothetical protein
MPCWSINSCHKLGSSVKWVWQSTHNVIAFRVSHLVKLKPLGIMCAHVGFRVVPQFKHFLFVFIAFLNSSSALSFNI